MKCNTWESRKKSAIEVGQDHAWQRPLDRSLDRAEVALVLRRDEREGLARELGPSRAADGWQVYQEVRPSMVQVVGVTPTGRYQMGSGIALPNGTVVTNCHVTLSAKRVQLFSGMAGDSASLQAATVEHDLCALYFPELKRQPVSMGESRALKIGDPVFAIGFNAGNGLSYQSGKVAELFEHDGGLVIRTTAPFTHGASGGGLFDREGTYLSAWAG